MGPPVAYVDLRLGRLKQLIFETGKLGDSTDQLGYMQDPHGIVDRAKSFGGIYEEMFGWSDEIRGTHARNEYRGFLRLFSRLAQRPIREIRQCMIDFVQAADNLSSRPQITVSCKLTIGDDVTDLAMREVRRLNAQGLW